MAEFDSIIDPPSQTRALLIGFLLAGGVAFAVFSAWYFLFHNDSLDHQGHFACHLMHDNPLFVAAAILVVLIFASGKDR